MPGIWTGVSTPSEWVSFSLLCLSFPSLSLLSPFSNSTYEQKIRQVNAIQVEAKKMWIVEGMT